MYSTYNVICFGAIFTANVPNKIHTTILNRNKKRNEVDPLNAQKTLVLKPKRTLFSITEIGGGGGGSGSLSFFMIQLDDSTK